MHDLSEKAVGGSSPARLTQDFFLGLFIVCFSVILLVWAIPTQVNDAGSFGLPPSLAPRSLAWVMIACGTILVLQNLKPSANRDSLKLKEVLFLVMFIVATGFMLILMNVLGERVDRPNAGFLLSAPLGLIAFTFLHSRAPLWAYAFNAIVAPLIIFAFFWWGLERPLP